MGLNRCFCYIIMGIILLAALSKIEQDGMSFPLGENLESAVPIGDEEGNPEANATMVAIKFASEFWGKYLKVGFARAGTPVGAIYYQDYVCNNGKFLSVRQNESAGFQELEVQSGTLIYIHSIWSNWMTCVSFIVPGQNSPGVPIELEEITATPETKNTNPSFWRILYWQDGLLVEGEIVDSESLIKP